MRIPSTIGMSIACAYWSTSTTASPASIVRAPLLTSTGSRIAGIGPAISVPIFETGNLRAQLKGRVAAYDAAVATYNQTLADALHDVADQVQSMRAAEIQNEHLHAATQAAANGLVGQYLR